MFSWILAAALALPVPPPVAASTAPAAPAPVPATHPIPLPAVDPIPRDEVMALPPELRDRLHEAVMAGEPMPTVRFQRLAHFIVDDDGLAMTYQENATYTVAQAYATRQANCLTFTLLVIALAKEAGLEAYPQEMGETLSWREVGGTV